MAVREPDAVSQWSGRGTALFIRHVSTLDADAVRGPSLLPGWTRAHVVAHVARNAEALRRLADWARTGEETPMYADPSQRAEEIETSARHDFERLRSEMIATSEALEEGLAALTERQWGNEIRTARGRLVPATEIPWMRVREVWLHAVDLDTGFRVSDVPAEVVDALLDDVTTAFDARADVPPLTLNADDRPATWTIHGSGGDPVTANGGAADLLGWLTGRSAPGTVTAPDHPNLPRIPSWL
jgi:maleylpyruvate isomerase